MRPATTPDDAIYGFPMVDGPAGGAKVAREQYVVETTADEVDRTVSADEIEEMYERLRPAPAALRCRAGA